MKLSNGEKLILMMLSDIYMHLGIKSEIDPNLVQTSILSGNIWGLQSQYSNLIGDEISVNVYNDVVDILDMWRFIENAYSHLSSKEKAELQKSFGSEPAFYGFDGNNELEHANVLSYLIKNLGCFKDFESRVDLNSHSVTLPMYRRMVKAFAPIRATLGDRKMDLADLTSILIPPTSNKAQVA